MTAFHESKVQPPLLNRVVRLLRRWCKVIRLGMGILTISVLCLPAAGGGGKADPKQAEPLTREGIFGSQWKGEYEGGTIEMKFRGTEDKTFLSVLVTIKTGGAETIGNLPWEIDA